MKLRRLLPQDREAAARLIHTALDTWYRRNLNSDKFGDDWQPFQIFADTYESLDPGCCVTAYDEQDTLLGCAFYHPRPTHVGIGIVATHPTAGGRGIARAMIEEIIRQSAGRPLRLVSSAMNLDSFSLYTRLGFVPHQTYQDLSLTVPADLPWHGQPTRPATPADIPAIADLEFRLHGLRREHDYHFFLQDPTGPWRIMIQENQNGTLRGFLAASLHPACRMLGPGTAEDETTMADLIHAQLHHHFQGHNALWLAPVHCPILIRQAYAWGARNVELHLASTLGPPPKNHGIHLPTFLPESG